ncbi:MAG: hypothetical protein LBQ54_15590 [Planctomycetaceae bacterium]|nr:hypothetical protein [Planctomycetaceae bacterium]
MPPAGRDAAAGGNARALHPGLLPASSRRSLSYRKSFQLEAEGNPPAGASRLRCNSMLPCHTAGGQRSLV